MSFLVFLDSFCRSCCCNYTSKIPCFPRSVRGYLDWLVEIAGRIDREPRRPEQAGSIGRADEIRRVIDQYLLEVRLSDYDIGARAGLDGSQILVAQHTVVVRVGDIEVGRIRREIDGEAGIRRSAREALEIEFAAFGKISAR